MIADNTWQSWYSAGAALSLVPGVHAPSRFSALLASTLRDCRGHTVIDAGCGAGLITVAALHAGAARVIAIDADPDAVDLTVDNVTATLGRDAQQRLSARQLDFRDLGDVEADLLAVNPPQRPTATLGNVEPDQRHLHEGGGPDGLETLRLVLDRSIARVVRTTAADILPIQDVHLDRPAWRAAQTVATAVLPMHPSWHVLTGAEAAVSVWDIARRV